MYDQNIKCSLSQEYLDGLAPLDLQNIDFCFAYVFRVHQYFTIQLLSAFLSCCQFFFFSLQFESLRPAPFCQVPRPFFPDSLYFFSSLCWQMGCDEWEWRSQKSHPCDPKRRGGEGADYWRSLAVVDFNPIHFAFVQSKVHMFVRSFLTPQLFWRTGIFFCYFFQIIFTTPFIYAQKCLVSKVYLNKIKWI